MNRRHFIQTLIHIPLAAKLPDIFPPLPTARLVCKHVIHDEYLTYLKWNAMMWVDNPRYCAYIDGINV